MGETDRVAVGTDRVGIMTGHQVDQAALDIVRAYRAMKTAAAGSEQHEDAWRTFTVMVREYVDRNGHGAKTHVATICGVHPSTVTVWVRDGGGGQTKRLTADERATLAELAANLTAAEHASTEAKKAVKQAQTDVAFAAAALHRTGISLRTLAAELGKGRYALTTWIRTAHDSD